MKVRAATHLARFRAHSVLLALLSGCAAGYPTANSPENRENDLVAKQAAQVALVREAARARVSAAAEELEAKLFLTDAGKVIARAIRAHGGWDAWKTLSTVDYLRDRIYFNEKGQPVTGTERQATRLELRVEPSGRLDGAATGEAAEEASLLALPFLLPHLEGHKYYLGIEADARSGELFEKIRCERPGGWFIAYFDSPSFVLRRVLEERNGAFQLTVFSIWTEVGGVKMATKRTQFRLRSNSEHRDLSLPDLVDVLDQLKIRA